MESNQPFSRSELIREKLILFLLCAAVPMLAYIASLPVVAIFVGKIVETKEQGGFIGWFASNFIELIFALSYYFVLYYVFFLKNNTYKRWMLDETRDGYRAKALLVQFLKTHGKWDFLIYAIYSVVTALASLLPLLENYIGFICCQQVFFYKQPLPDAAAFLLNQLLFAAQYICAFFAAVRYWDKNRLHR